MTKPTGKIYSIGKDKVKGHPWDDYIEKLIDHSKTKGARKDSWLLDKDKKEKSLMDLIS